MIFVLSDGAYDTSY